MRAAAARASPRARTDIQGDHRRCAMESRGRPPGTHHHLHSQELEGEDHDNQTKNSRHSGYRQDRNASDQGASPARWRCADISSALARKLCSGVAAQGAGYCGSSVLAESMSNKTNGAPGFRTWATFKDIMARRDISLSFCGYGSQWVQGDLPLDSVAHLP